MASKKYFNPAYRRYNLIETWTKTEDEQRYLVIGKIDGSIGGGRHSDAIRIITVRRSRPEENRRVASRQTPYFLQAAKK